MASILEIQKVSDQARREGLIIISTVDKMEGSNSDGCQPMVYK